MYKRQQNGKHQPVVPQSLVQEVIKEKHDPKYVAHPGMKRTRPNFFELLVAEHAKDYRRLHNKMRSQSATQGK